MSIGLVSNLEALSRSVFTFFQKVKGLNTRNKNVVLLIYGKLHHGFILYIKVKGAFYRILYSSS